MYGCIPTGGGEACSVSRSGLVQCPQASGTTLRHTVLKPPMHRTSEGTWSWRERPLQNLACWYGLDWGGSPDGQPHGAAGRGQERMQGSSTSAQAGGSPTSHAASVGIESCSQTLEKVVSCGHPHTEENQRGWAVEKKVYSPKVW